MNDYLFVAIVIREVPGLHLHCHNSSAVRAGSQSHQSILLSPRGPQLSSLCMVLGICAWGTCHLCLGYLTAWILVSWSLKMFMLQILRISLLDECCWPGCCYPCSSFILLQQQRFMQSSLCQASLKTNQLIVIKYCNGRCSLKLIQHQSTVAFVTCFAKCLCLLDCFSCWLNRGP